MAHGAPPRDADPVQVIMRLSCMGAGVTRWLLTRSRPSSATSCLAWDQVIPHRPVSPATTGDGRPDELTAKYAKGVDVFVTELQPDLARINQLKYGLPEILFPHLFRDGAATAIAIVDPEHVGTIASVLGHSTLATSERHYNQARGLEAGRRYHGTIEQLRNRVQPRDERKERNRCDKGGHSDARRRLCPL
jgi:hypothetical protein